MSALAVLTLVPVLGQAPAVRSVALTFDDLPHVAAGAPDTLARGRAITSAILRALAAHRAPAVGFVNASKLAIRGEVTERTALLEAWVDGGHTLGNHTSTHPDFNRLTIAAFEADIEAGTPVVRALMSKRAPAFLYFRHPMNHTGDTAEKKVAIERYLASHGYRNAPHTVENDDYLFNAAYVRARTARDEAAMHRLREAYIDFTIARTAFAEQVTPEIFGRAIPQTMLMHANDINADTLEEILSRLEERGYRFITLDAALSDAAYATPDTLVSRSGPSWLWRWAMSKGLKVDFSADPEPPGWVR